MKTKLFIYVILLWALISIACESTTPVPQPPSTQYDYKVYPSNTLRPTNTQAPAKTPRPSPIRTIGLQYTRYPTKTPGPTNTPRPTGSPTVTPLPNLVSCTEIVNKHLNSTDLQWHDFISQKLGQNFNISGEVRGVFEDNSVLVYLGYLRGSPSGPPNHCHVYLYNIPHDTLLKLYEGQRLEGYGTIMDMEDDIFFSDWITVRINTILDTLIIH